MLKFTIPSYEQIENHIKESVEFSDWAIVNRGLDSLGYMIDDCYSFKIDYVSMTFKELRNERLSDSYKLGVLPSLCINNISSNEEYEFFYPKYVVPDELQKILDDLIKINDNTLFPIVGKFTINGAEFADEFKPVSRNVYKYNNKLYIHTKCDFSIFDGHYFNKKLYKDGDWIWLTVERVKWKALDDSHIIPDTILFGGINYQYINEYLNNYFSKEIIQFSNANKNIITDKKSKEPNKVLKSRIQIEKPNDVKILNDRSFFTEPTIGREEELEKLMVALAQDLKLPILVGESGVGKTAIVDQLAYMIQNNKVPKFLNNQLIVEVDPTELVAGTTLRGEFEQKLKDVIDFCLSCNAIMLINEIHKIYRAGTGGSKDSNDMAGMIKTSIDRDNLRIIGTTTTEEYSEYFENDSLKRRFKKIIINEPKDEVLYKIIEKVINDYSIKNNISIDILNDYPQIIDIIIDLTTKNHRTYNDKENNPSLSIGIIDTVFGYAKYYDDEILKLEHLKKAILDEYRIYETAKKEAIEKIENLVPKKTYQKSIPFPINK